MSVPVGVEVPYQATPWVEELEDAVTVLRSAQPPTMDAVGWARIATILDRAITDAGWRQGVVSSEALQLARWVNDASGGAPRAGVDEWGDQ